MNSGPEDPAGAETGNTLSTVAARLLRCLVDRNQEGFFQHRAQLNRNPEDARLLAPVVFETFRTLVEMRFERDEDLRSVARFLLTPRLEVSPNWRLPLLESEALIRSALGERRLVVGIDGRSAQEIRMQLIVHLVEDLGINGRQVDAILARAELAVASGE